MNDKQRLKISKAMSLLLRHRPELGNLSLDAQGWVDMQALLEGLDHLGIQTDVEQVEEVIVSNDKQRFAWDEIRNRVRANQGHSVAVQLNLPEQEPPDVLFHGTVERFLTSIQENGLHRRNRQHVHLSGDEETAQKVGLRRGKPIILKVHAKRMHMGGHTFYLSENGVWLTDHVPVDYLLFPEGMNS
jgi:putative RNA 2'-phosphotransferase